jgi:transitional endoplasmic reticulum ATPase
LHCHSYTDISPSVTDATNDDNSIIALSNNTMETLQLFRGDTVLVKGKKRKDTVLIVLADDDLEDGQARINRVVRHNLRVKHGDIITVHPCPDIKYVSRPEQPLFFASSN